MSASPQLSTKIVRPQGVLGELLHSLSQPLTGLRCSLELSLQRPVQLAIEQIVYRQQESAAGALQQTEKVIALVQLMREYLDTERGGTEACSTALAPGLRSLVEELGLVAAVRSVRLRLIGTCSALVAAPESRLRLALNYLLATIIDAQPEGGKVMLLLGEGPAGAVLRVEGEPARREQKLRRTEQSAANLEAELTRVRIAIASRVLENAGASIVFGGGETQFASFVLRVPRP
jgi:signal transduction histidine kinase